MTDKTICKKHKLKLIATSLICPECRKETGLKAVMDYCGPNIESGSIDLGTGIFDLVADLLHLAHQNDIEPDYIIHMAGMHFYAEVQEEAELQGLADPPDACEGQP